jgi:hypothetical protein
MASVLSRDLTSISHGFSLIWNFSKQLRILSFPDRNRGNARNIYLARGYCFWPGGLRTSPISFPNSTHTINFHFMTQFWSGCISALDFASLTPLARYQSPCTSRLIQIVAKFDSSLYYLATPPTTSNVSSLPIPWTVNPYMKCFDMYGELRIAIAASSPTTLLYR